MIVRALFASPAVVVLLLLQGCCELPYQRDPVACSSYLNTECCTWEVDGCSEIWCNGPGPECWERRSLSCY